MTSRFALPMALLLTMAGLSYQAAPSAAQVPPARPPAGVGANGPIGSAAAAAEPAATPTGGGGSASGGSAPGGSAAGGGVSEAKISVLWLKDEKTGRLQPVPNLSLEELERLILRDEGGAENRKPVYRIDSLDLTGSADNRYARFQAHLVVAIDAVGWVRVPIDLRGVVLEAPPVYQGPGKLALQLDAERREYVAWFHGNGDKPHELTLQFAIPLERIAGQEGIRLYLPRTPRVKAALSIPATGLEAHVSAGAVLEGVAIEGKQTKIRAAGVGGEFQLSWTRQEVAARRAAVLLEASADVLAIVDGRSVAYETQLTVNSFGGEFDHFKIRLPPEAVLVDEGVADLEIVRSATKAKAGLGDIYEVRRTVGATKSLTMRLRALRPLAVGGQTPVDFGGFEVLEAVRQWGYLGIVIEGDWQALWGERSQVRQVDATPESFRGRSVSAVFEYFGRPYSLFGRIVPRETRITVDPSYKVQVTAKRMFLEASLPYRVGGAKVFSLDVDLADWHVDEVGPAEIVDVAALAPGQTKPLTIPLLQPSIGDFQLIVRAHRDLPEGAKSLAWTVPQPRANVVGEASITVEAAENVELAPRDATHTGLVRRPSGALRDVRRGKTWTYASEAVDARFDADFRVLSRSIDVRSSGHVRLRPDGGDVVQKLSYVVAREPIDGLDFDLPPDLTDQGRLEIVLGGEPATWVVVDEDAGGTRRPTRIRVELPTARIGAFDVTARYPLLTEPFAPQTSAAIRTPLLVPVEGALRANELTIERSAGLEIQHVDESWTPDPKRPGTWLATDGRTEAVLGIRWEPPAPVDDTIVERLWIQTVMSGTVRQERAVFRLTTGLAQLHFQLPPGGDGPTATINGARVDADAPAGRDASFTLRLPKAIDGTYVIDVRYRVVDADATSLAAPRLDNNPPIRETYRHLVVPADTCLAWFSPGYLPEFEWAWRGLVLARRPLLSQGELESWAGARHESPPAERANVYLFSSFGESPPLALRWVKRTTLVLAASGSVLLLSWALLYLPGLRNPALLVPAAVGILALAGLYPDLAPLAGQAAGFGVVLGVAAVLLERNVNRRRRRVVRTPGETSSGAHRGSTKTRAAPAGPALGASTATVDLPRAFAEPGGST